MNVAETRSESLPEAANRWAALALELKWVEQWVEGAIFPCEMVYFLAMAEIEGIKTIMESGRQDGYSTIILGEFARRTGVRVISIDYEEDADRGRQCRERLAPYPVETLVGDAFTLVGETLNGVLEEPMALLVDGPKSWSATALLHAAVANRKVKLIALHQHRDAAPTRALLDRIGPKAFYEDFLTVSDGPWAELRAREKAALAQKTTRSLNQSSLAILLVPDETRRRMAGAVRREFMFFQPPLINLFWRLRWYEAARRLHSSSFRVFNSRLLRPFKRK